ncbi:MAG: exodeoxyribonuclease V subunit gamma, partial [Deltaproteobacteria bacterium]|nr:exodeoxyribonuclease V subunit gamma [Deltaproteobacteria bacterium]
ASPAPRAPLVVVGPSYLPRGLGEALAWLAESSETLVYALSPTRGYWEDMASAAEQRRYPDTPSAQLAPLPLRLWGRPCRDTARLFGQASGYDHLEAYRSPGDHTVLARLQSDILELAKAPGPGPGDDSIRIHVCPSSERELEAIGDDIWEQLDANPELRCSEIALYVAGSLDEVQATIGPVFHRLGGLPYHLASVPLSADSRLVEAFEALVELPLGSFTRPELLGIMLHPAVLARFPEARPEAWVELADQLGIVRGASQQDNQGTYIEGDLFNWDQGARRLAIGAVWSEHDTRTTLDLADRQYRPLALDQGAVAEAAQFGLLSRSLVADAERARDHRATLSGWSAWFEALVHAYLEPTSVPDQRARARLLQVIGELADLDDGTELGYKLAAAVVRRQVAGLTASRGELGADGVMVAPLELGHVIPAKLVYIAGLGDGAVPASGRRSPLDARQSSAIGDMEPTERIRVAFLEALLAARSALRLSYVGRDPKSGESRAPSALISELDSVLSSGYCDPSGLRVSHPLRPWDEPEATRSRSLATRRRAALSQVRAGLVSTLGEAPDPTLVRRALDRESLAPVRSAVGLVHQVDGVADETADDVIEVPISVLRRFLESPLQAWSGYVVGISAIDEPADRELSDEPLALDALALSSLLREVFIGGLRAGDDADGMVERLRSRIAIDELGGSFPTGLFARTIESDLAELLTRWSSTIRGTPEVLSFGRARESAVVSELLPPIELELQSGRRAQLVGVTQPRVEEIGALLITPSKKMSAKHRVRGFFEHVLSAAADREPRGGYALLGRMAETKQVRLANLDGARARDYLATLTGHLVGGRHDYALPCELAVAALDKPDVDLGRLLQSLTTRRASSDSFGPLGPQPGLAVPDHGRQLIESRFGLLRELEAGG